jgi:hypothetical protein
MFGNLFGVFDAPDELLCFACFDPFVPFDPPAQPTANLVWGPAVALAGTRRLRGG